MSGAAAVAAPAAPAAPISGTSGAPASAPATSKAGPEGAPKVGEQPKPPPQRIKGKYKVDGAEAEFDYDEQGLARDIQRLKHFEKTRGAADKRMAEFEQTLKQLGEDPVGFLKGRNVDLIALAKAEQAKADELAAMDPASREARAQQERADKAEKALQEMQQQQAQAKEAADHQALVQNTVRTLDAAIKLSGHQRSGELLKTYAEVMEMAERAGEPPMSPEQIVEAGERLRTARISTFLEKSISDAAWRGKNAPLVQKLAQSLVQNLEGPQLIEMFGKDAVTRLVRTSLEGLRKNPLPVAQPPGEVPPAAPARPAAQRDEPVSLYGTIDRLTRDGRQA